METRSKSYCIILTIVISLIVTFAAAEVLIRLSKKPDYYLSPEEIKARSLQYEPALFARHLFAQKELAVDGWGESKWYINEKGYRGHNFVAKKPPQLKRIIFYGGSSVFDSGSGQGQDWPHRVEGLLHEQGFSNIEVINAGIPGHASFDAVGRLLLEGHIFTPDYVVLYNAWNDIKYFHSHKPLLRKLKPLNPNSDPRINYQNKLDCFMCRHSKLYLALRSRYYGYKINQQGSRYPRKHSAQISAAALKQYKLNVQMFVDLARNIKATPVLMTQARLLNKARGDLSGPLEKHIQKHQRLTVEATKEAFAKIDQVIYTVAREKGALVIDSAKYLSAHPEFFHPADAIHLSEQGNQRLAELTAQHFIDILRADKIRMIDKENIQSCNSIH